MSIKQIHLCKAEFKVKRSKVYSKKYLFPKASYSLQHGEEFWRLRKTSCSPDQRRLWNVA